MVFIRIHGPACELLCFKYIRVHVVSFILLCTIFILYRIKYGTAQYRPYNPAQLAELGQTTVM